MPSPHPPSPTPTRPLSASSPLFTIDALYIYDPAPADVYVVRPTAIWASLSVYSECTIGATKLKLNSDIRLPRAGYKGWWYARVLEIRGHSPTHVYLRLYWYYRRHQLPFALLTSPNPNDPNPKSKPKPTPYDIDKIRDRVQRNDTAMLLEEELLASNDMGVVNAIDVQGEVEVVHLGMGNGKCDFPGVGKLFWCWRLDVRREVVEWGA
ncbi:hypothetical protein MMC21_000521 [Puttea exsequens]|nr:hypothetical protein [Puttea exsequens]